MRRKFLALLALTVLTAPAFADCSVTVADPNGGHTRACTADELADYNARLNAPPPTPSIQEQLVSIYMNLTPDQQAQFATLAAAVKLELDSGQVTAAKLIIQNATVPTELQTVQQQMLSVFP